MNRQIVLLLSCFFLLMSCMAQPLNKKINFTKQDSLRGSIGPERAWWDVLRYDVSVTPDYQTKSIRGKTIITYKVLPGQATSYMQVDLQQPLVVDSLFYDGKFYINDPGHPYRNEGNVWHIPLPKTAVNSTHTIGISYHGKPRKCAKKERETHLFF